jgi:hypothetical protein
MKVPFHSVYSNNYTAIKRQYLNTCYDNPPTYEYFGRQWPSSRTWLSKKKSRPKHVGGMSYTYKVLLSLCCAVVRLNVLNQFAARNMGTAECGSISFYSMLPGFRNNVKFFFFLEITQASPDFTVKKYL